jgi:fatty acid desaturase
MDRNEPRLLIFPFLQVVIFAGACAVMPSSYVLAGLLVLLASLFMNFSLHITYHYHVHFKRKSKGANRVIDLAITSLLGVPFHYYQMLHWNHHKYDNALGDFTSTWKQVDGVPVPKNFLFYGLLWPLNGNVRGRRQFEIARREGYLKPRHGRAMGQEMLLVAGIYGALLYLSIPIASAYLGMVYAGWALIAMHNYGQHLPEVYGETKGNSYYNAIYNRLTLQNGLHYEHHHRPSVKYWDLTGPPRSEIAHPHLVEGFFAGYRRRTVNTEVAPSGGAQEAAVDRAVVAEGRQGTGSKVR